jgi:hypothetical protein
MLDEVQRAHATYSGDGKFRGAQLTLRLSLEEALEWMTKSLEAARDRENPEGDEVVLTIFAAPPVTRTEV